MCVLWRIAKVDDVLPYICSQITQMKLFQNNPFFIHIFIKSSQADFQCVIFQKIWLQRSTEINHYLPEKIPNCKVIFQEIDIVKILGVTEAYFLLGGSV